MKRILLTIISFLPAIISFAQEGSLSVTEITLSNGMEVWLNEDHSQPKIFGAVVVKAGAKDCPDTGLAHYLEHLLFKGTEELGTVDYQAEKVWLDSIALCYNRLAETSDEGERLNLQKEINRLSIKAADYAIPNEFDLLTAEFGGTGLNAATSYDYTYYFNTFSPQYMAQWAELNSHRMIHPVFRLFQGELETVYEEKNRSADNTMQAPLFEMIKVFSEGNPYSYQIIGSTENLKNPRLGEMMDFFKKYYVGCNMGLILSGDIDAASLPPLLESTFGRIPKGQEPEKTEVRIPVLSGGKDVKIKAEIPLIKISVFAFNGPADKDEDAPALDLATSLLTNSFSSGLLDSLVTTHKVLMAGAMRVPLFNEMGVAGYAVIPSLPFGSLSKAEKICREQVEKIKRGEFSDEAVETLKLEAAKLAETGIETIEGRSDQMVTVMSQGRSWSDYLRSVESIRDITREDIIRVANKYFNDNYIRFEKVKGSYPKDKVSKPEFDPIVPRHAGERSEYAQALERMPVSAAEPRLLDFDGDITRIPITPEVALFYKKNTVNDIFSLTVTVNEGEVEDPLIPHVAGFVNSLGTDSLSVTALAKAWQSLGTSFSFSSGNHSFNMSMTGFDSSFGPSMKLMRHVTDNLKKDKESFKEQLSGIKLEKRTFLAGGTSNIMQAAMQRVFFGEDAPLLKGLSEKELKAVGMDGLLARFGQLMDSGCDIFYCGSLPEEEVVAAIRANMDLERRRHMPVRKIVPYSSYAEPTVFFYDLPGSRQTQMMTYQTPARPADGKENALLRMLGEYVGGGMYSLMFQEVREFRALAYSASGGASLPSPSDAGPAMFYTMLGTQADKSLSALQLVDSLLRTMPLKADGLAASSRAIPAAANNSFPSMREIGPVIRNFELAGYTDDPDKEILDNLDGVTAEVIRTYYDSMVRSVPLSYIIVGDRKTLPMDEIAKLGKLITLDKKDIYK